jgi:hypothetical protein
MESLLPISGIPVIDEGVNTANPSLLKYNKVEYVFG